jgi:hypothetical protein
MGRQAIIVLYVVLMAATVVIVDLLFFRNRFWERLTVNIGIVGVHSVLFQIPETSMSTTQRSGKRTLLMKSVQCTRELGDLL